MQRETVVLAQEKETLLITLYGKALENRMPDSILHDRFADDIIRRIDYDFAKLKIRQSDAIGLAMRAKCLDAMTAEFLSRRSDATVLHLGCGLDSRVFRLDPPASVRWFDVDYPEVIGLRHRFYPERDGYRLIASSIMAPHWLDEVPRDRPALIVAEGLLPYLEGIEVRRLLKRLVAHFPSGEMLFDAYSPLGVRLLNVYPAIRATGARLHWGLDSPHEIERWIPQLTFLGEISAYDQSYFARLPWPSKLLVAMVSAIPSLRRLGRLLRYRFEH